VWRDALQKILLRLSAADQERAAQVLGAGEDALKRGTLSMRSTSGSDKWKEFYAVLTTSEFLVTQRSGDEMVVVELLDVRPNCSVFETNLGSHAFEVVTPKKVLHLACDTREAVAAWMDAIRSAIANSPPDPKDTLLAMAMRRIEEDVFYDVSFHEKKTLGVVFEKAGEWAVVKHSNCRATGIAIGSVLTAINGESCVLGSYERCIDRVKDWQPPLHFCFRRAPVKSGYLVKLSRERRGSTQNTWKERWFELDEGRLLYKQSEEGAEVKQELPLMGSAVSLLSSVDTGKFFCFQLVSGSTRWVMQAVDMDEMMDWASLLYHASAVANGGAYIVARERRRLEQGAKGGGGGGVRVLTQPV
jgi:hypothetical protein